MRGDRKDGEKRSRVVTGKTVDIICLFIYLFINFNNVKKRIYRVQSEEVNEENINSSCVNKYKVKYLNTVCVCVRARVRACVCY